MPSSAYIGRNGQLTKICPCNKSVIPITQSCPCAQKNSPVLLDSGLVSFTIPLLSAAAVGAGGFSFNLEYYSDPSTTSSDGTVGYGFNYSQNVLLTPSGDNVLLQLGENTQELFVNVGGGVYSSANNNTAATLAPAAGGGFTITTRGGTVSNWTGFDSPTPGRMTQFADRFGNTQTFNWGIVGCSAVRLLGLADSYGRPITLDYWGPEFNYALRTVTDFTGRRVDLSFDSLGHLVAVVGAAVTRGANNNANVFPGFGHVFMYDIDNPRPERQNDIIAIYHPNQVTPYLSSARTVDVAAVYANALAREQLAYHQDPTDTEQWGKVQQYTESATGTGSIGAGAFGYMYVTTGLPVNLANPADLEQLSFCWRANGFHLVL